MSRACTVTRHCALPKTRGNYRDRTSNDGNYPEINYPAWVTAENNLRQLAKHFSAENPGKKMEVVIYRDVSHGPSTTNFLERASSDQFLLRLKEEATVSISGE